MDNLTRFDAQGKPQTICHFFLALGLAAALCLSGCSSTQSEGSTADDASSDTDTTTVAADTGGMDFEYSKRDLDASFDSAAATTIELASLSATVTGSGASVDGSTVTITEAGTYVVAGTLTDGQLVVDTADDVKVQIVLAGAAIHNEDGPAIYIKQTDKAFITLAEGTQNTLSDGPAYALEEGSDEPYATLFSKADLALNGEGSLSVVGSYRHAVCSKDDLVITGGIYSVTAVEDAFRGRDCVKICGGDFTIDAGGDGIKSNRDDDATRGFVSIDGGTFSLVAGDDGVQAETLLRVDGGTMDVEAVDDATHSNGETEIQGGTITINAGDDGVHAETKLTVSGGVVDIQSSYEGYEAEKIFINGGESHVIASDDALNAASAETATTSTDSSATGDTTASDSAAPSAPSDAGTAAPIDGATPPAAAAPDDATMPSGAAAAPGGATMPDGATPPDGEGVNESQQNGGKPMSGMAEGGRGMGDENCLIQINGGYTAVEAGGDGIDSNGSFEMTEGVLLVSGPTDSGNGAFDYDLTATISGGTAILVGPAGMAQNFTSGEQPFAFSSTSGSAGQSVALTDDAGTVVASYTPTKQFSTVIVSSPSFTEGGTYHLVVGGTVSGANTDGFATSGSISGGSSTTSITTSVTATSGMGGLGADNQGQAPGIAGAARGGGRGVAGGSVA